MVILVLDTKKVFSQKEKLKGRELFDYIEVERKKKKRNLKEIAKDLGMDYRNLRNFRVRWKKKILRDIRRDTSLFVKSLDKEDQKTNRLFLTQGEQQRIQEKERLASLSITDKLSTEMKKSLEKVIDTREWSHREWNNTILNKKLLDHQAEDLHDLDRSMVMLNNPRQHGKTSYTVEPWMVRKLCESAIELKDYLFNDIPFVEKPILYISCSYDNVRRMIMTCKNYLVMNPQIHRHYGELVDYRNIGRQSIAHQSQIELSLITRIDKQLISLRGTSIDSRIRGGNAYYTLIDDPIDHKKKKDKDPVELTDDWMEWFFQKILPLAKGNIAVIGTRYYDDDVYERLSKLRTFKWVVRKAIIGSLPTYELPPPTYDKDDQPVPISPSDIKIVDSNNCRLLAPELWCYQAGSHFRSGTTLQNICFKHHMMETGDAGSFNQEFQQETKVRDRVMKWEWLNSYSKLPLPSGDNKLKWAVFIDVASGESKKADYTGMILMCFYRGRFYIQDIIWGRWTGKYKQEYLEKFVSFNANTLGFPPKNIKVLIETVRGQRDFFQRIRDESVLSPKDISPAGRGEKKDRIVYGLAQDMENGLVFISDQCRSRTQFKREVDRFPRSDDDHIIDAADQCRFFLKHLSRKKKGIRGANERGER